MRGEVPPRYALNDGPFPENDPTAQTGDYFDPNNDTLEFYYIKFWLHFATPKYVGTPETNTDSANWKFDPMEQPYLLGQYSNVDIRDYYRNPEHIVEVEDDIAAIISEAVRNRPAFYIITEYSPVVGQNVATEPKRRFPFVAARYDMIIRFSIDL
jgi:hypothetical protein